VHRLDAVSLYRLALENAEAGVRYHGVAEEGIIFRDIAEAIGQQLNIPVVAISKEDAAAHFGWFAHFAAFNCPASNQLTRQQLNWEPVQPTLLADIAKGFYFK
jgi:nucleoside-diphosphate-sugar epimerase